MPRPANLTKLVSVFGPAVRIRTSTPRLAVAASISMKLVSGTKYGFVMYSVSRAPAIERARNRSAVVLPSVGVVYSNPAARPSP